jgi:hypothetical protein
MFVHFQTHHWGLGCWTSGWRCETEEEAMRRFDLVTRHPSGWYQYDCYELKKSGKDDISLAGEIYVVKWYQRRLPQYCTPPEKLWTHFATHVPRGARWNRHYRAWVDHDGHYYWPVKLTIVRHLASTWKERE